jgi:hypothetical protein
MLFNFARFILVNNDKGEHHMHIKPVEKIPMPGYPDKYAKEAMQALAQSHPRRWLHKPLLAGVLSATVALGLSGCDEIGVRGPFATAGVPPIPQEDYITMGDPTPISVLSSSFVPLFEYGEGTGAIGCVSIAAPLFFSEEEAFAILKAAFAEAGLTLNQDTYTQRAILPVTELFPNQGNTKCATTVGELTPDGLLEVDYGLPLEFVSAGDVVEWEGETEMHASVEVYQIKEAAQTLATNNPGLVVFYDPVTMQDMEKLWELGQEEGESDEDYWARWEAARAKAEQVAKTESEQLLRQQAQAFIAWLHTEGVI